MSIVSLCQKFPESGGTKTSVNSKTINSVRHVILLNVSEYMPIFFSIACTKE